jgi:hypothetical protein
LAALNFAPAFGLRVLQHRFAPLATVSGTGATAIFISEFGFNHGLPRRSETKAGWTRIDAFSLQPLAFSL